MASFFLRMIAVISLWTIWGACTPFSPFNPTSVENNLPAAFTHGAPIANPGNQWWTAFSTPRLTTLIEAALRDNLTLQEGWARLAQAGALTVQSGAALQPDLSLSTSALAGRSRTVNGRKQTTGQEDYAMGLFSTYEIDLWGKIRSERDAARLSEAASREDLNTLAITLSANVADRWVHIFSQQAQRKLLIAQLAANETQLELMTLRFKNALASSLDVFQQRQAVERSRALIPMVENQERLLQHELALLLGKSPLSAPEICGDTIPLPEEIPETGIPAQLLTRRPDIQAAFLRLCASGKQIDAARANRLPQISLSATAAHESGKLALLFDNWLLSLAGNLTAPLFDGKKRAAEVERTRAVAAENMAAYRQTILRAIKEVEDALVTEEKLGQHLGALTAQLEAARNALNEARSRYQNGLNDYLPVLTSLISVQNLEQDVIQRKTDQLVARINLYRALGGTWTDSLIAPTGE